MQSQEIYLQCDSVGVPLILSSLNTVKIITKNYHLRSLKRKVLRINSEQTAILEPWQKFGKKDESLDEDFFLPLLSNLSEMPFQVALASNTRLLLHLSLSQRTSLLVGAGCQCFSSRAQLPIVEAKPLNSKPHQTPHSKKTGVLIILVFHHETVVLCQEKQTERIFF